MQQIIVIIIGMVVLGYVIFNVYKTITKKATDTKCGGCNADCTVSEHNKSENKL